MAWDCGEGVKVELHDNEQNKSRVYIIIMSCKDNRFNVKFCTALNTAMDKIMAHMDTNHQLNYALVIRGQNGFFSNGLDLSYLMKIPNPHQFLIETYQPMIARFLSIGLPTVAFLDGHAFAGGLVLALAADYRIAPESSKALFSMNELLIRAAIPAGMLGVLRAKLKDPSILRECILARRWNVSDALNDGIIDEFGDLTRAIQFAHSKAIAHNLSAVLNGIKSETYRGAISLLTDPKSDRLDPFRFALANKL